MNLLYHGSTISGLAALRPDAKGAVFLTLNSTYALFYIRDREINWVTCAVGTDGIVRYEEQFQDQLRTIYGGIGGYIYACEANTAQQTGERGVRIAREAVTIVGAEWILDAHDEIVRREAQGLVRVTRSEEMTDDRRRGLHEHLTRYIREGGFLRVHSRKAAFLGEHFPEA